MGPRRRRVVWSEGAARQLDEAIEYVAQDSLGAAVGMLERLLDAADSLDELADRGHPVEERPHPHVRQLLVRPYRLIYSTTDDEVVILRLLHQRRDFDRWNDE